MSINILASVFLLIVIIMSVKGYQNGLFGLVYNIVAWVVMILFTAYAGPQIETAILEKTNIYDKVYEASYNYVSNQMDGMTFEDLLNSIQGIAINSINAITGNETGTETDNTVQQESSMQLPDGMDFALPSDLQTVVTNSIDTITQAVGSETKNNASDNSKTGITDQIDQSITEAKDSIAAGVAEKTATAACAAIARILAMFIGWFISRLIRGAIETVHQIPIIGGVSKLIGLAAGFFAGCMIVYTCLYIIGNFAMYNFFNQCMQQVYANPVLTYMYNNNLLEQLIGGSTVVITT